MESDRLHVSGASRVGNMRHALIVLSVTLAWSAGPAAQPRAPRALDASVPIGTFIATGEPREGYRPADRQRAQWALEAWQRAAGSALRLSPSPESAARVRVYWAGPQSGQYGEMRALLVNGQAGAAVYIPPGDQGPGPPRRPPPPPPPTAS